MVDTAIVAPRLLTGLLEGGIEFDEVPPPHPTKIAVVRMVNSHIEGLLILIKFFISALLKISLIKKITGICLVIYIWLASL